MTPKDQNIVETIQSHGSTRREFLTQVSALTAGMTLNTTIKKRSLDKLKFSEHGSLTVKLHVNGKIKTLEIDPRATLLDTLREQMKLTGTKKGCDRGQCGACTVLADGRRINSCLTLTAMCEDKHITTIEGLGTPNNLHAMQQAFLKRDAFQCGYCTPGQICSAVGLIKEGNATTDDEIRELMSGNICRCGAYQNILDAIKDVQSGT